MPENPGFCSAECVMTWLLFGGAKPCLVCGLKMRFPEGGTS